MKSVNRDIKIRDKRTQNAEDLECDKYKVKDSKRENISMKDTERAIDM